MPFLRHCKTKTYITFLFMLRVFYLTVTATIIFCYVRYVIVFEISIFNYTIMYHSIQDSWWMWRKLGNKSFKSKLIVFSTEFLKKFFLWNIKYTFWWNAECTKWHSYNEIPIGWYRNRFITSPVRSKVWMTYYQRNEAACVFNDPL